MGEGLDYMALAFWQLNSAEHEGEIVLLAHFIYIIIMSYGDNLIWILQEFKLNMIYIYLVQWTKVNIFILSIYLSIYYNV